MWEENCFKEEIKGWMSKQDQKSQGKVWVSEYSFRKFQNIE